MSNVEIIRFLINEANQLTADTPKKVCKYVIDLLAKATQEAAGSALAYVEANVWIGSHGRVLWNILCCKDSGYCTPYVRLMSEPLTNVGVSSIVISTWDNAAEIFVKAIDILTEDGAPHIPAIRESFKVANTPKFDPEQAIWDAMGWMVPNEYIVFFVGAVGAQAFIKCGGSAYGVIRHKDKDQHRIVYNNHRCGSGLLDNPRQVDTDKYEVLAVLPNGVYVAKRKDGSGWWSVSTGTLSHAYQNYDNAVKDAIKWSQGNS